LKKSGGIVNITEFYNKLAGTIIELGDTFEWEFYGDKGAQELTDDFKDDEDWNDDWRIVGYDVRGEPIFIDKKDEVYIFSSDDDDNRAIHKIFDGLGELESFITAIKIYQELLNKTGRKDPDLLKSKLLEMKKGKKDYIQELLSSEIDDFWED